VPFLGVPLPGEQNPEGNRQHKYHDGGGGPLRRAQGTVSFEHNFAAIIPLKTDHTLKTKSSPVPNSNFAR